MSARCCRPQSPSKKQLGTIIATYKWISSMIKMFGEGGKQDALPGGYNLDGGRSGASLREGKRKKNPQSCLFRHLYVWSSAPTPLSPLAACSPPQQRHLSLNTTLMKVIHFNGASFQPPVIKACAALDWEAVETVWLPVLQINNPLQASGHLNTLIQFTEHQFTDTERGECRSAQRRNLNHVQEMKTTFS